MDNADILDFLSHFGVYRPGNYDVPVFLLEAAVQHYRIHGDIHPIYCWEALQDALYLKTGEGFLLSWNRIALIEDTLNGSLFDLFSSQFNNKELSLIRENCRYSRIKMEALESYPVQRKIHSRIISNKSLRKVVFERDGYKCVECGDFDNLSIDHITPIREGGDSDTSNLQTLCMSCNSSKGAKM